MHCFTSWCSLWDRHRTAWTSPAGCPLSYWSCASWRCFSSPGQGRHSPLLLGAPQENIPPTVAEAALAIALEGISCDWLWCKHMKSCLCILETIKPRKIILDLKWKILTPKKVDYFTPKMVFILNKSVVSRRNQTLCFPHTSLKSFRPALRDEKIVHW